MKYKIKWELPYSEDFPQNVPVVIVCDDLSADLENLVNQYGEITISLNKSESVRVVDELGNVVER